MEVKKIAGVLILFVPIIFCVSYASAAWQNPMLDPPDNNANPPIHIGSDAQVKWGDLTVNNLYLTTTSEGNIKRINTLEGYNDLLLYGNSTKAAPIYLEGSKVLINNDTGTGNVGIGTANPSSLFVVGDNTFQINSSGNLIKINGVSYSWPSTQGGASTVLVNNGSGTLTWGAGGASSGWTDDGVVVRLTTETDRVGIGTSSLHSDAELTVNTPSGFPGAAMFQNSHDFGEIYVAGISGTNGSYSNYVLSEEGDSRLHEWAISYRAAGRNLGIYYTENSWDSSINGLMLDRSGPATGGNSIRLGVGLDPGGVLDQNYRLTVARGGIKAESPTSYPAAYFSNSSTGYAIQTGSGSIRLGNLAGSGIRMMTVDADGIVSSQAIPGAGVGGWTDNYDSVVLTTSSDWVGVGTNPDTNYKLTVSGGIKVESTSSFPAAYFSNSNGLALRTGSGKIGFGTSSPAEEMELYSTDYPQFRINDNGVVKTMIGSREEGPYGWVGTMSSHDFYVGTGALGRIHIDPSGIVDISNLKGTGTRVVTVDADGILSATTTLGMYGPKAYVGKTTVTKTGATVSGYSGGSTNCVSQYGTGAKMCSAADLAITGTYPSAGEFTGSAWYSSYEASMSASGVFNKNDCQGWTSASTSIYGSIWTVSSTASYPSVSNCGTLNYILCCK